MASWSIPLAGVGVGVAVYALTGDIVACTSAALAYIATLSALWDMFYGVRKAAR